MREAVDYRTPFEVLAQKEEVSSDAYCDCLTFEAILELVEWATANKGKWPTVKAKLRNPQMTCRELAHLLGIANSTVVRHLAAAKQLRKARA